MRQGENLLYGSLRSRILGIRGIWLKSLTKKTNKQNKKQCVQEQKKKLNSTWMPAVGTSQSHTLETSHTRKGKRHTLCTSTLLKWFKCHRSFPEWHLSGVLGPLFWKSPPRRPALLMFPSPYHTPVTCTSCVLYVVQSLLVEHKPPEGRLSLCCSMLCAYWLNEWENECVNPGISTNFSSDLGIQMLYALSRVLAVLPRGGRLADPTDRTVQHLVDQR